MRVQRSDAIEINAPADEVWRINGEEFTSIGGWARSVAESRPIEGSALPGAPAVGRVCQVAGFGEVHEHLEAFDADGKTFRLTVREGLPFFVRSSEFHSTVVETGPDTSRFEVIQTMDISPFPGVFLYPLLRRKLNQAVEMIMADLAYKAEQGAVHPAKAAILAT